MDNIFDNFVSNVYSGGSAMEFFDDSFEVVGGIDDISVASIFGGGCGCADTSGFDEEYEEEEKKKKGASATPTEQQIDDPEQPNNDPTSAEVEEDSLLENYEPEDFTTDYKPADHKQSGDKPADNKKKKSVDTKKYTGGLSAEDVSELLSVYN